ncbi:MULTISPECIES: heavy metal sensor histidine kinase [unclassified Acinetobacter]|uniref:heavy metal sensor histidine kinase n=1 Tax=unclassified Acinetobacter TaxID=196816 RepID=UPI002935101D|nr:MULTISPECIES: heavy metal sensor histidine kinase [unclassified Acinetobacter]WOE32568.1 heavy metal sensor histidine kinase [Acinetobacter sp. SAAs470]WOE38043.1 heavy metal sensor histidine kinase [Acinetobacter sp. SAAs474]
MSLKIFRSLELRLTLFITCCSALVLCAVAGMSYLGMTQILRHQQDRALIERIERLEVLLQDSHNVEQIIARPKLYQNMLGNLDNLLLLIHQNNVLININPLHIPIPQLSHQAKIQFKDLASTPYTTRIAWKTIQMNHQPYLLVAGKYGSERMAILAPFQQALFGYVLGGIIAILILCALVSHIGLKSLRQLRQQTHAINIQQLQQRLNLKHPPQEIEQLAIDINHMLDRIEAGYNQLNRFSEDIAHEFRTPLNNLIGQTEILLTSERTSAQYQELFISNLEDYQRLKRMIDSMLFLARADRNNVLIQRQSIDINKLIDDICSIFEYQLEEQNCHFDIQLESLSLYIDSTLIQQALYNLISNALIHGGNQRIITIAGHTKSVNQQNMISLSVITHGVTIAHEHLAHLFDRFYQCNASRSSQQHTGGLGLSIVASIMTLHGGSVHAYNSEQGICFELLFPQ